MAESMVNNRQVNFWRGDQTPPTIYHIWIRDNSKMLLYDGSQWVIFLDNKEILDIINQIQKRLDEMQEEITKIGNKTVNGYPIKNNPVLGGVDILTGISGNYIDSKFSLTQTVKRFDDLLTTQIIE